MIKLFIKKNKTNSAANTYAVKSMKVKTTLMQHILRWVLWLLIIFLMLRGAVTIVKGDKTKAMDEKLNIFTVDISTKLKLEKEASEFAESFAREYLTYSDDEGDGYKKRLSKYLAPQIASAGFIDPSLNGYSEAIDTWTITVNWYTEKQINVDIMAKVKYQITTKVQGEAAVDGTSTFVDKTEVTINDIYIRVPIGIYDSKYVVEDLPVFIPEPDKAEEDYEKYFGATIDDNMALGIKEMLGTFFKAYYEGGPSEITYFMSDNRKKVKGLSGRFLLKDVDEISIFKGLKDGEYIAIVSLYAEDSISKQVIKQSFHVEVETKESRYFIKKFDVRVGNLNYPKE